MSLLGHLGDAGIVTKHPRGLGVKHKRHCEKTLDPFYELISPMGLESILDAISSRHAANEAVSRRKPDRGVGNLQVLSRLAYVYRSSSAAAQAKLQMKSR
uniref:Uncharacterized protein n=1 Tax=Photinus pyralis TaxID=7054 RepID=A0A1Y1MTA5_PHOPY